MQRYLICFFLFVIVSAIMDDDPAGSSEFIRIKLRYHYGSQWDFTLINTNINKSIYAIPDLSSSYSLIYESIFRRDIIEESSIINNNTEIEFRGKTIQVAKLYDSFKLKTNKELFANLTYYYTNDYVPGLSSILGFAYSFPSDSYSIIHQLYIQSIIPSKAFALIDKYESQSLFLGGIPSEYTQNKKHSYIDIIGMGNKWDFYVNSIRIKNETKETKYELKRYAYFITLEAHIYAPRDFFDRLVNEFFSELLTERHCHVLEKEPTRYFLCSIHYNVRMGIVVFSINGFEYTFTSESLWSCGEEFCIFSIRESPASDQWMIGSDFYGLFSLLFDYDKKRVDLYTRIVKVSNGKDNANAIDNNKTAKTIIITGVVIILIGIGILIYMQMVIKKKS